MTRDELRALQHHSDPILARLATEALVALTRIQVRQAHLAGAPTHLRVVEGGLIHTLGPKPPPEVA